MTSVESTPWDSSDVSHVLCHRGTTCLLWTRGSFESLHQHNGLFVVTPTGCDASGRHATWTRALDHASCRTKSAICDRLLTPCSLRPPPTATAVARTTTGRPRTTTSLTGAGSTPTCPLPARSGDSAVRRSRRGRPRARSTPRRACAPSGRAFLCPSRTQVMPMSSVRPERPCRTSRGAGGIPG